MPACLNRRQETSQAWYFGQKQGRRPTQDEGDGNLLGVSVEVEAELLKQPLLVVRQHQPAEHSRTLKQLPTHTATKGNHSGRKSGTRRFSSWSLLQEPFSSWSRASGN